MDHRHLRSGTAAAIVAALVLAACAGDSSSPSTGDASAGASAAGSPSPSSSNASPAGSSAPSGVPVDVTGAADAVSNLGSYNLDIVVRGSVSGTQSMSITSVHEPVEATHYVVEGLELITIAGQGTWINQDGTWVDAPGGADAFLASFAALRPDALIAAFSLGLYTDGFQVLGTEEHNFVQTTHYHLDASQVAGPASAGLPDDGLMDLWVATDGGYLVGMQYQGTDPDSGEKVQVSIEVSGINDPSTRIEPPI